MTIDPDGGVTIAAADAGVTLTLSGGGIDVTGNADIEGNVNLTNVAVSTAASELAMYKNRAGATLVTGDALGSLTFYGFEGTGNIATSYISSTSSGTIALNSIASDLKFYTHRDSTDVSQLRLTIDPDGGITMAEADAGNTLEITGGVKAVGEIMAESISADATGARISIQKSRTGGAITSGDDLGSLHFWGDDGTSYISGAYIKSDTSGTIATDRIPANLEFYTSADDTAAAVLRMTIDSDGGVNMAAADAGVTLTIAGGGISSTGGITEATEDITVSTATKGIVLPGGLKIITGAGTPHGSITAPIGSLYLNTTGSGVADRLWVNTDNGTSWTNFTSAA